LWASNRGEEIVALRKGLLVFGVLAAILTALILVLVLTTNERRTPPSVITGLIATDTSFAHHGQIDLAWNPSDASDFAYYSIYAAETEITDITELSPVGRINDRIDVAYETTKYRMPGLQLALFAFLENTEYWFAVTAVDTAGNESEIGASVSVIIELMPPPPPKPTSFIVVNRKGSLDGFDPNFSLELEDQFADDDTNPFSPYILTVPVGTTVAWINHDDVDMYGYFVRRSHIVVSDTGLFHAELTEQNNMFSYTFNEVGVFDYYCDLHTWEIGRVIVVEQAVEEPNQAER
jgi:plastocyanin